jgi:hypothetical protein
LQRQNKFAIILLNWNGLDDTLECLESLEKLTYSSYEIILVDNGSTDNSLEVLKERYPHLTYIENETNLGFAEGNNRGMHKAMERGADWVVLLNNDTVVAPNFLEGFNEAASGNTKAGVLGAKIFYHSEPATLWYAGGGVDKRDWSCYHIGNGRPDLTEKYRNISPTEYACGCALAVSKEALCTVGGMSPEYFLIWEEIDWCYRLRKAGFECLFTPGARVWHKLSQSFIEGNRGPMWHYYYMRNRLLFVKRHASARQRLSFYTQTLLPELLAPHPHKKATLLGVAHYFQRRFGEGALQLFQLKQPSN